MRLSLIFFCSLYMNVPYFGRKDIYLCMSNRLDDETFFETGR